MVINKYYTIKWQIELIQEQLTKKEVPVLKMEEVQIKELSEESWTKA